MSTKKAQFVKWKPTVFAPMLDYQDYTTVKQYMGDVPPPYFSALAKERAVMVVSEFINRMLAV